MLPGGVWSSALDIIIGGGGSSSGGGGGGVENESVRGTGVMLVLVPEAYMLGW